MPCTIMLTCTAPVRQAQTLQLQADKQSLLSKLETQTQRMELAVQQAAAAALQTQHSELSRDVGQGSPVQRAGLGTPQSAPATPQLDRGRLQSGGPYQVHQASARVKQGHSSGLQTRGKVMYQRFSKEPGMPTILLCLQGPGRSQPGSVK